MKKQKALRLRKKEPSKPSVQQSRSLHKRESCPIIGIGASAGGIEALKEFFAAMPADSGMAFVIVQHLEPTHESRMAEILGKHTAMKAVQAEDGMRAEPNSVFTNPPGKLLSVRGGHLVLGKRTERSHVEAAIDHFLISLAEDQGPQGVCIILSGSSGTDGPRGLRAVRAAGGMCMAQDPGTAQFAAMPQAAIDTGLVDYVLGPAQMPVALLDFAQHPQVLAGGEQPPSGTAAPGDMEAILNLLRMRTNSDYRHYKRTTVVRRIQRRMGLRQIDGMGDYLKLLQSDTNELTQLAKDMLIGVSSFFRDAGVFEEMRTEVILPLVKSREDGLPLRAWVPGCATGEEAYSVAMLLLEARSAAGRNCPIQVFATDVDDHALDTGRAGEYPLSIADDVSAQRLEAFFVRQGQTYKVDKHLRETVVFSRHNVLTDPPFSKLDLVTCRNVLIYLESAAQKKVLDVFSFALSAGGHLLLGKSEGVSGRESLFEPISKQNRIYRLTRSNRRAAGEFPPYPAGARQAAGNERDWPPQGVASVLSGANLDAILKHFDASLVLVDPEGKILYFHGRTERYLGHSKGPASLNIFDMTGGSLSAKLRRAIDKALQQQEPVTLAQAPLPQEGSPLANLTVVRVGDRAGGRILAIIFEDARPPHPSASAQPAAAEDEPLVAQLEAEVKSLRTELRTDAEGHDAATEELKAANEEMMSMNEELQSANEELEASKEEMQSLNEELNTVNGQLNDKVGELTDVNNDLANLFGATELATVFLDTKLQIKRFTPQATQLLNLISADIGRPLAHITQNFDGKALSADAEAVMKKLSVVEKEVQIPDGRWYTMRLLPYRTLDNRIDGAVVTFADVTRLKRMEAYLQGAKAYAESIVLTVREPLLVLDSELRVVSANPSFYQAFKVDPDGAVGQRLFELAEGQWGIPELRKLLEGIGSGQSEFNDFQVERDFAGIGHRIVRLNARRIEAVGELPPMILLAFEDVTQREQARTKLESLAVELETRVQERTAELAEAVTSLEGEVRERLALNETLEQRVEQLRALAIDLTLAEQRERKRLAQILHDDLQQMLVGAKYHIGSLRHSAASGVGIGKGLKELDSLLAQSIQLSRMLAVDLSPPALSDHGLASALKWLGTETKRIHGLAVRVTADSEVRADAEGVAVLLFQAVRELLLNVIKHARVKSASVRLSHLKGNQVQIEVADKGAGFDRDTLRRKKASAKGLGLFSVQERIAHMGGSMEIQSAPGKGTRVTLVAQIHPAETPARE